MVSCAAPHSPTTAVGIFALKVGSSASSSTNSGLLKTFKKNFDDVDTACKVSAVWRFDPCIGIELDYVDLCAATDTIEGVKVAVKVSGTAPHVILRLPRGPIGFFDKAATSLTASRSMQKDRASATQRRISSTAPVSG